MLVSRTLAGGGEVGASGAQSPAGGVEREEVGGVEAGEDELRLGGDAAEAGDAATEVDGGDDRLAAGRRGHVGHAEERDLGGEVGGLARRLRRGPGGGRHRPGDESEQQREVAEGALHGWVGGGGISRSLGFVGGGLGAGWRGRLWMEKAGASGEEGGAFYSGAERSSRGGRYRCGLGQVQVLVGLVLSWAVSWTLFSAGLLARLRGILA